MIKKTDMPHRNRDRFFFYLALASLAVVVAGFAGRAIALPILLPPMTITIGIHIAIMLGWYGLVCTQAGLIARKNHPLHRRLGMFSPLLASAIIIAGTLVTLETYARRIAEKASAPELAVYLSFSSLLGFAALYVMAYVTRKRSDFHKRFILLAGIAMMLAATFRLAAALGAPQSINMGIVFQYSFITAIMLYDMATLKRVHLATIVGMGVCLVMTAGIFAIGANPAWAIFVRGTLA